VLRRRRILVSTIAAVALGVAPAAAFATTYQGSISSPVVSADGSRVSADIVVNGFCDPNTFCGFFPEVTTVIGGQPCAPVITGSGWVGPFTDRPFGSAANPEVATTVTWSEWPRLYSGPKRACLYAQIDNVLVAQADYQVPVPPAPPTYAPPLPPVTYAPPASTPTVIPQSLSRAEAVAAARRWLKRKYGRRWTRAHRRTVKCSVRTSSAQLGCNGVWVYGRSVLSKSLVVTETEDAYLVDRSFASAPVQVDAPAVGLPDGGDFCSTHVCIPNYEDGTGTTVRCSDGSYSHSGGKQGACSYHGGVARSARASVAARGAAGRRALTVDAARLNVAQMAGVRSLRRR
jgi:hypothetical protein